MTVLQIIQPDNPLLRRPATRVNDFGPELQTLIDDMVETMADAEGVGLGGTPGRAELAASFWPACRTTRRASEQYAEDAGKLYVVANPKIIQTKRRDGLWR